MKLLRIGNRDNFFYLFVALMVLIVFEPVMGALLGSLGTFVSAVSLSAALVIALWSLQASRIMFFSGIALVVRKYSAGPCRWKNSTGHMRKDRV